MDETSRERERCIAIVRSQMEGVNIEMRRVLTRIINEISNPRNQPQGQPEDEVRRRETHGGEGSADR